MNSEGRTGDKCMHAEAGGLTDGWALWGAVWQCLPKALNVHILHTQQPHRQEFLLRE